MRDSAKAKRAPSTQQRRGPKRTRPWEQVLDRWAAGERSPGIARALDIDQSAVTQIVFCARRAGDKRAVRRKAPTGHPGTGSVVAGAWVPYWADPRQLALPLAESGSSGAARAP
jgi:hypothetical protein